ncbi:sugar 3,4-ketoisomerase [Sphingobacterium suaedae]|uniref:Sugar 3,4-ketoisomerase n=1 Tax=Sphingobacterium suaedae TaxID=1686402 RepID=A0ABW5KKR8_9SPHI
MAYQIDLKTFTDERGNLTVIEKIVPFEVKRIFYIYGVNDATRGGHRHHRTLQAAICLKGSCTIYNHNGAEEATYQLTMPNHCLVLETQDWHQMYNFSPDAILMVLASEYFDPQDYIYEPYIAHDSLRRSTESQ